MAEKVKLIDVSKCTGCRGCQLACKQWNQLPARQTKHCGTYQNPPDLQPNTWTLIRFQEVVEKERVKWLFRKDGCMHCTDAACVKVCPSGALHYTELGTVGSIMSGASAARSAWRPVPLRFPGTIRPRTRSINAISV